MEPRQGNLVCMAHGREIEVEIGEVEGTQFRVALVVGGRVRYEAWFTDKSDDPPIATMWIRCPLCRSGPWEAEVYKTDEGAEAEMVCSGCHKHVTAPVTLTLSDH